MPVRQIDPMNLARDEDWFGNNIAVTCPNTKCRKVFVVSSMLGHPRGRRKCPACGNATAYVKGGPAAGEARVEWEEQQP
jgi:ribosomal protein S27E